MKLHGEAESKWKFRIYAEFDITHLMPSPLLCRVIITGINLRVSEVIPVLQAAGFSPEALQYFGISKLEKALEEYRK